MNLPNLALISVVPNINKRNVRTRNNMRSFEEICKTDSDQQKINLQLNSERNNTKHRFNFSRDCQMRASRQQQTGGPLSFNSSYMKESGRIRTSHKL